MWQPQGRRTSIEIIADILRLLRLGDSAQPEVAYAVKIGREQSERYVRRLIEAGLLEEVSSEIGVPACRITRKGLELLGQIENMQEMLPPMDTIDILHRSRVTDFNLGRLLVTKGIADIAAERRTFADFVEKCLDRHRRGDWGDMSEEDKDLNERGLARNLRLFSSYESAGFPEIWIITEPDRSFTTVMLPDEYAHPETMDIESLRDVIKAPRAE